MQSPQTIFACLADRGIMLKVHNNAGPAPPPPLRQTYPNPAGFTTLTWMRKGPNASRHRRWAAADTAARCSACIA